MKKIGLMVDGRMIKQDRCVTGQSMYFDTREFSNGSHQVSFVFDLGSSTEIVETDI